VARSANDGGDFVTSGTTGVTFSRQFLLSGAPQGWLISLTGVLDGQLFVAQGPNGDAIGRVSANAQIGSFVVVNFLEGRGPAAIGSVTRDDIHLSDTKIGALLDGMYTVTGSVRTTGASPGGGFGGANFFDARPGSGFQVSVLASPSPLPEPSGSVLLGTGVGMLVCYRLKKMRSVNLRDGVPEPVE
jgi:hypothetical protein